MAHPPADTVGAAGSPPGPSRTVACGMDGFKTSHCDRRSPRDRTSRDGMPEKLRNSAEVGPTGPRVHLYHSKLATHDAWQIS